MKRLALIAVVALWPHSLFAQGLAQDDYVTQKLVAAQVGDILRKQCPDASARMMVVLSEMLALERHAKNNGHDDAAINAFLKDRAEKDRIRALANQYLQDAGAVEGDGQTYCDVARAEVAAQTMAGQLLRVAN
jgi:hypothetical protein